MMVSVDRDLDEGAATVSSGREGGSFFATGASPAAEPGTVGNGSKDRALSEPDGASPSVLVAGTPSPSAAAPVPVSVS
eukprot:scaffold6854_cov118-Isochrysis_galbana.AAC.4